VNLRGLVSVPIILTSLVVGLALTILIPHADWLFKGKPVMTAKIVEYGGTQWVLTNMRFEHSDVFSAAKGLRLPNLERLASKGNIIGDNSQWMPDWAWPPHGLTETVVQNAVAAATAAGNQVDGMSAQIAMGWPMRAFTASTSWIQAPDVSRQEFERGNYKRNTSQVIPYWPMPLGLAVDTALFGGGAFLLLHIGAALTGRGIAARRSSSGRCTRCGYLRSGLSRSVKCPECGERG